MAELARVIGARKEPVLIPWDCTDDLFEAYWRRPEAYLDDQVRRGVSVWARVGPQAEQRAVRSLPEDLVSGPWAERNRDLVALDAAELGLRLLVSEQHPYARIRDPGIGEALSHSPNQPPVPAADKARQLCWGSGRHAPSHQAASRLPSPAAEARRTTRRACGQLPAGVLHWVTPGAMAPGSAAAERGEAS